MLNNVIDWLLGLLFLCVSLFAIASPIPGKPRESKFKKIVPRPIRLAILFGFFWLLYQAHMYITFLGLAACFGVIDYQEKAKK